MSSLAAFRGLEGESEDSGTALHGVWTHSERGHTCSRGVAAGRRLREPQSPNLLHPTAAIREPRGPGALHRPGLAAELGRGVGGCRPRGARLPRPGDPRGGAV